MWVGQEAIFNSYAGNNTVHPKVYAQGSGSVLFCCGLVLAGFPYTP